MTKSKIVLCTLLGSVLLGGGIALGFFFSGSENENTKGSDLEEEISASDQEVEAAPAPVAGNAVGGGGAQGLLNHDTYITFSDDPTSFPPGELVTESASVPDVIICTVSSDACDEGEMLIYFVDPLNETNSMEGVSVIRSTDSGETWTDREPISIAEKTNKGPAVDPSVVQLSDGSLRMYFFGPDKPFGGPQDSGNVQESENPVYSAVSEDGVNFTQEEGTRLSVVRLTDPEVIVRGEEWFMYYSVGTSSGVATSSDGLTFEDQGTIEEETGGVPGAIALTDDSILVYGCSPQGILVSESQDGLSFSSEGSVFTGATGGICDPSVQAFEDGYVFVYKKIAQ